MWESILQFHQLTLRQVESRLRGALTSAGSSLYEAQSEMQFPRLVIYVN